MFEIYFMFTLQMNICMVLWYDLVLLPDAFCSSSSYPSFKGKTRMPYIVNHSLIHPCTDLELLNSKRFHHDAQIFHCMKKGIDLWVDPAWRNNTMVFFPPPFGKSWVFFQDPSMSSTLCWLNTDLG